MIASLGAVLASATILAMLAMTVSTTFAARSECADGIDNDGNGRIDYPQDDACESLDDDYEGISLRGNFITVTDDKEEIAPGGSAVYIVTLKQQREDARLVNVTLHLPHQSNIVSASDGGSVSEDTIRWTNVSVNRNVTKTLQVHANVNPNANPGEYMITRAFADGAEATDTTLVKLYIPQSSYGYTVHVSDGRDYVQPGEEVTYSLRVRNTTDIATSTDVRLHLPTESYALSNSDGGRRDSYTVLWPNVRFLAGEEKIFTARVQIDPRATDRSAIRARASVGATTDFDQTVVKIGTPYDSITTSLSDGLSSAERGQLITYRLTVTNTSPDTVATNVAVDAGLPQYGEFVSAGDNGYFDGSNIRWLVVNIAPKESRRLTFTMRVRPDAPVGSMLQTSAVADGVRGAVSRDTTEVVDQSTEVSSFDRASMNVLFRKTADRREAFPGGSIRYTLSVRNTLDHVIADAVINDRYDGQYLVLESYDNAASLMSQAEGNMRWKVPVLQPGESWQTSYILNVTPDAPAGMELSNVATIRGADLDGLALTEKVTMVKADVLGGMPQTGANMNALIVLALSMAAGVTGVMQKKLMMS